MFKKSLKFLLVGPAFYSLSAFAGEIFLSYDQETKAYVIDTGYLLESDFIDNDVAINDPETNKEITLLTNEDSAPNTVCHRGPKEESMKIVERMITNIDGNGDYYLESFSVTYNDADEIEYWFMRIGEDGRQTEESKIPKCND